VVVVVVVVAVAAAVVVVVVDEGGRCVQIDAMRCRRAHVRFVELLLPLLLRVHAVLAAVLAPL
tara:strand:+ start:918 stop:1106 length:189 start_codon:yes stop_codon:yes gene_type:complete